MTSILRRLRILLALLIIGSSSSVVCFEVGSHRVIEIFDLALEGERSKKTKRPILLLVSRGNCPYCVKIKNEILEPMILSGDYDEKIIIREIMIDPFVEIRDFEGTTIDASEISRRYRIKVTPTLLFLGPKGKELTERIVGINTLELFSYYVDKAIEEAALNASF